jgi:hypothetical protein
MLASLATGIMPLLHDALLPTFWWLAFSASLLIADRHNAAPSDAPKWTWRF